MKKAYAMLLAAFILFAGSCKKDKPVNEPEKEEEITIVGKWKLTRDLYTAYIDGKLEVEDIDLVTEGASQFEFKADGTGRIYYNDLPDNYTLFTYEANGTTSFIYTTKR